MKTVFLSMFLGMVTFSIFAQSADYQGYIVSLEGDTTTGWIRLANQSRMHKKVTFRPTPESKWKTYTPSELNGYRLNQRFPYERKNVTLKDGTKADRFLRVLLEGQLTLYIFNQRLFLRSIKGEFQEMIDEQKTPTAQVGESRIRTSVSFTNLVFNQLQSCPELLREVQNQTEPIEYTHDYLQTLFIRMHECNGGQYQAHGLEIKATDIKLIGSLETGINSLAYYDPFGFENAATRSIFSPSFQLNPGFGISIFSPRKNPLFGFQGQLWFKRLNSIGKSSYLLYDSQQIDELVQVKRQYLQFDFGLYTTSFLKRRPLYTRVGVGVNYYLNAERLSTTTTTLLPSMLSYDSDSRIAREILANVSSYIEFSTPLFVDQPAGLSLGTKFMATRGTVPSSVTYLFRLFEGTFILTYSF